MREGICRAEVHSRDEVVVMAPVSAQHVLVIFESYGLLVAYAPATLPFFFYSFVLLLHLLFTLTTTTRSTN